MANCTLSGCTRSGDKSLNACWQCEVVPLEKRIEKLESDLVKTQRIAIHEAARAGRRIQELESELNRAHDFIRRWSREPTFHADAIYLLGVKQLTEEPTPPEEGK